MSGISRAPEGCSEVFDAATGILFFYFTSFRQFPSQPTVVVLGIEAAFMG